MKPQEMKSFGLKHVIIFFTTVYFDVQCTNLANYDINNHCLFRKFKIPLLRGGRQLNGGPKINAYYNPSYGFEPYWPGGDWVFERPETTTHKLLKHMCGNECPDIYLEFGEVCGRNLTYAHKTFASYCDLVNEDCSGRAKWMIAYRGKCQNDLKLYPTKHVELPTRANKFIEEFGIRNPTKREDYPTFTPGYRPQIPPKRN